MADTPRKAPAKKSTPRAKPTAADRRDARKAVDSNVVTFERRKRSRANGGQTMRAADLEVYERRVHALNLRRLGLTWEQVAHEVRADPKHGARVPRYTRSEAATDVRALLDQVTIEAAVEYRVEDLATLAALQRGIVADAMRGDAEKVRLMLMILERRSRYLGLDAPVRHAIVDAGVAAQQLAAASHAEVAAAALDVLDDLLPHLEPLQLPAGPP